MTCLRADKVLKTVLEVVQEDVDSTCKKSYLFAFAVFSPIFVRLGGTTSPPPLDAITVNGKRIEIQNEGTFCDGNLRVFILIYPSETI